MSEEQYYPLEQPDEISPKHKDDAMGSYLMMFGSMAVGLPLPIINLLASIIYYYGYKNKSRFVKFHCLQSLYSQLPTSLLNAVFMIWTFRILFWGRIGNDDYDTGFADIGDFYWGFLITLIILNLVYFTFSLIAAFKARKGKMYYMFFFGKLAYHQSYKLRPTDNVNDGTEPIVENKPPV